MFLLSRPCESHIRRILAGQRASDFSYPDVGATRGEPPAGYAVLQGRVDLGLGSTTFDRAAEALRRWKMFAVPRIQLCWPTTPIQPGEAVAVVIRHFGFWSLNCCKIAYVIDEEGPVRRFGFAYGTLPEHAEQGEERFTVEWHRASDVVCYDILSFSRPGSLKVKVAYPAARWLQRSFLRQSSAAMVDAVRLW
ncbi:MAG TPA: DUF1990 domain-containing protein [Candidatus Dormibacteraeota bacterium]|jgi:uncharacterized protein (UPF0548 family)|nr:DUF1990 domain-containing protein [Candidatus Dormibacteraeota bacterium]